MKKIRLPIFFIMVAFLSFVPVLCVSADESKQMSGLVYGDDYSFFIDAPNGWVLDPKTAKEYGVNVVLYQTGYSFRNAPAVMYTSALKSNETIEEVMKNEAMTYQDKYEGIQISKRPIIKTKDKKDAYVQYYKGKKKDQTDEAVAFVQEKRLYILLVLSARSEHDFQMAYAAFEQFVRSYALSDIRVNDKSKQVEQPHQPDAE